ncbi:MAG: amino-acid N-acetyltransferase [Verrucomicrobiota bacterium]
MKASDLRGILTYIPQFRERIFVINVDSIILADENAANLFLDISVLRSLNIRVVLVCGVSVQVKKLGEDLKISPSNLDGIGATDEKTLYLSKLAAGMNVQALLQGLSDNDLRGAASNAIVAHPFGIISGQDQLLTGKVERVDAAFLEELLRNGVIPVIAPLGFDGDGKTFRVNSDNAALAVAEALRASKLIFLTDTHGIDNGGKLSTQLSISEAEDYLKKNKGVLSADVASKLEHGVKACKNGVSRAHILNGLADGALIEEIFSNEGVGTMIYANEYTAIRKAMKKDVRAILTLIQDSVASEELIQRTRADVLKELNDFYVFEIDGNIVGCVAIPVLQNEPKVAEMGCLFVSSGHENQGIGKKLMLFAENRAKEMGVKKLLALSTQAFSYLQKKGGFREGAMDVLPPPRRQKYDQSGRNSKILFKELA